MRAGVSHSYYHSGYNIAEGRQKINPHTYFAIIKISRPNKLPSFYLTHSAQKIAYCLAIAKWVWGSRVPSIGAVFEGNFDGDGGSNRAF